MGGNLVETLIGAVVLVVAAVFLIFAYDMAGVAKVDGYELVAKFNKVDGIRVGTILEQEVDQVCVVAVRSERGGADTVGQYHRNVRISAEPTFTRGVGFCYNRADDIGLEELT